MPEAALTPPERYSALAQEIVAVIASLAPGEVVVCHHRKGAVIATERHAPSRLEI